MLDVGIALMERVRKYTLKREALSLDTPDETGATRTPATRRAGSIISSRARRLLH
jgi:hypothetical protein